MNQWPTQREVLSNTAVYRNDPLVLALSSAQGKTAEELDAFSITYGAV